MHNTAPPDNPGLARLTSSGLFMALLALATGCGDQPPPRSPLAGKPVFTTTDPNATEHDIVLAGMKAILAMPVETLREHADPTFDTRLLTYDDPALVGRVVTINGGLKRFWPVRDGAELPEGYTERWEGYVIDLKLQQPYLIVFPGTPSSEIELENKRVQVTGVFTNIREYVDQADRKQMAPVLVTRDIRSLIVK